MTQGKRVTMAELTAQHVAKVKADQVARDAWETTLEGKAEKDAREAYEVRMRAAEERFAAENPPNLHEDGRDANEAGQPREAPDHLTDDQADLWLVGFDSLGSDEDA